MPAPNEVPAGYRYGDCRGMFRHAWYEAESDFTPDFGTPLVLVCDRCGTERRDVIHADGEVKRKYTYPEGYSIKAEEGSPKVRDFRLQWLLDLAARSTR